MADMTLSEDMKKFIDSNPNADVAKAKARDAAARSIMFATRPNDGLFDLYEQGTCKVIQKRYEHRPAQQGAEAEDVLITVLNGPATRAQRCSICKREFKDFARHNAERHVKDPVKAFFCPVKGCDKVLYRPESSPIDDHMAAHCRCPNAHRPGSRAYDIVNSTKKTVLGKLTFNTLHDLAGKDRTKLSALVARKDVLLPKLPANLGERLTIQELTIPGGLIDDTKPNLNEMANAALVKHIICLRQAIQEWEDGCAEAERFLAIEG